MVHVLTGNPGESIDLLTCAANSFLQRFLKQIGVWVFWLQVYLSAIWILTVPVKIALKIEHVIYPFLKTFIEKDHVNGEESAKSEWNNKVIQENLVRIIKQKTPL